jgi:hypothetical protein
MKSRLVTSPQVNFRDDGYTTLFLAGTIDNGTSVDWQKKVANELQNEKVTIFNPRRESWNAAPTQEDLEFQIEWELERIEMCEFVLMHLEDDSKSPVSLLELGLLLATPDFEPQYAASRKKLIVSCSPKFYRYTNVARTCERYDTIIFHSLDDAIDVTRQRIRSVYTNPD